MSDDTEARPRTPILYVTDLTMARTDPADLFDLAFLMRSPDHDLRGVCLPEGGDGDRLVDALAVRAETEVPFLHGEDALADALRAAPEPLTLIVVGGYNTVAGVLENDQALFRSKVARLFLVGGTVNDYPDGAAVRLPTDPRLRQRHPERFAAGPEPRLGDEGAAFGRLLTSGEGVIWLPRDICLWRYSASGVLAGGDIVSEFLLRELFFAQWQGANADPRERLDIAERPVLLSAPPAFFLAVRPEPFLWMRLFRTITARVETSAGGIVTRFDSGDAAPNLYTVVAIDGQALGKRVTAILRDRPLVAR